MERMVSACGLVCTDCEAFKATRLNDPQAIARVAAEWTKAYGVDVRPEHVWCDGCMAPGERKCHHTTECEVRACVVKRSHRNCAECVDYGCPTLSKFFEMAPPAKQNLDALRAR